MDNMYLFMIIALALLAVADLESTAKYGLNESL